MSENATETTEAPEEERPLTAAEQAELDQEAERVRARRLAVHVGPIRPADSVEARIDRLEQTVRSSLGAAVLRPDEAVAAADLQDQVAAEAAQAESDAAELEAEPSAVSPLRDEDPTVDELLRETREELDRRATLLGVVEPDKLATKHDVAEAILASAPPSDPTN